MKALITGASSGIGKSIAIELSKKGYEIIAVAKDKGKLELLKKDIKNIKTLSYDLTNSVSCIKLYEELKNENIDILVNNAGFGEFGEFENTDLNKELNMIDLNIKAVHILTKYFLKDFKRRNSGYILNVSSSAAFQPGPLMSTYYSTKAYVLRLTTAIYEELRRDKSKVVVSVLCPGPVKTNFNNVANVKFDIKSVSSDYVAKYAINKMFKKKLIIIPTFYMKAILFITKLLPTKITLKMAYNVQIRKRKSR